MKTRYLALDLSSRIGYCWFEVENKELISMKYDNINFKKITPYTRDYDKSGVKNHPKDFYEFVRIVANQLYLEALKPSIENNLEIESIIIEQTNRGMNRWTQKLLEWIHCSICNIILDAGIPLNKVHYIDSSSWRSILKIRLTKDQKSDNKKLRINKNKLKKEGKTGRELGGKTTIKHVALNYVNEKFGLELVMKDNDIADAICVGYAYLLKEGIINEYGNPAN